MRIQKGIIALSAALVLLCAINITAFAHDVPDLSRKGSIQITMRQGENVVSGGTLTLYRAGALQENDSEYSFVLTGNFSGCSVSLDEIQSAGLAAELARYADHNNIEGITKDIDSDGQISFGDLEPGMYLIVQNEAPDGYNRIDSFLVTVPMNENGIFVYDVDASPKVELKNETGPDKPVKPVKPSDPVLPQTGQLNWPVPVLALAGLGLFSVGWLLRFRKNGVYEK